MAKMASIGTSDSSGLRAASAWKASQRNGVITSILNAPAGPSGPAHRVAGVGKSGGAAPAGTSSWAFFHGSNGHRRSQVPKRTELDSLPEASHKVKVEAEVVERRQDLRRDLAGTKEMMEERARNPRAGRAGAAGIDRSFVVAIAGVLDLERPFAREQHAVAAVPRRQHAVEEVDALANGVQDVVRRADPHQVARLVLRQDRRRPLDRLAPEGEGFADRDAADRMAVEVERGEIGGRPLPQVPVSAPLDDPEQPSRAPRPDFACPALPTERAAPGLL